MTAKITLLLEGQKLEPTFYHRHGDWFGWGCVAFSVVAVVRAFLAKVARQDTTV